MNDLTPTTAVHADAPAATELTTAEQAQFITDWYRSRMKDCPSRNNRDIDRLKGTDKYAFNQMTQERCLMRIQQVKDKLRFAQPDKPLHNHTRWIRHLYAERVRLDAVVVTKAARTAAWNAAHPEGIDNALAGA